MEYTHTCSCGAEYQSDDPEPYFCKACIADRQRIAAELDQKRKALGPVKRGMSDLQMYDAISDGRGFARASDVL